MKTILIIQAAIGILLTASILMQSRGEGLGVLGGSSGGSYHTKRGFEKFLLQGSVVLGVLFILVSIMAVYFGA